MKLRLDNKAEIFMNLNGAEGAQLFTIILVNLWCFNLFNFTFVLRMNVSQKVFSFFGQELKYYDHKSLEQYINISSGNRKR